MNMSVSKERIEQLRIEIDKERDHWLANANQAVGALRALDLLLKSTVEDKPKKTTRNQFRGPKT